MADENLVHGVPLTLLHGRGVVEVFVPDHVGVVRDHPDLVDYAVLSLERQVLDGDDDVLLLVRLDGGPQQEEQEVLHLSEGVCCGRDESEVPRCWQRQHQHLIEGVAVEPLHCRHHQPHVPGPGRGVAGLRVQLQLEAGLEAGEGLGQDDSLGEDGPGEVPGEVRHQGGDPAHQGGGQEDGHLVIGRHHQCQYIKLYEAWIILKSGK